MTTVLCWDIDGTLLNTGRAGIFALEDAAAEVIGKAVDFSQLPTAGLTDRKIAINVLEAAGLEPEASKIEALLELYAKYLPESLPRRQGRVLSGVREILEQLKSRSDVLSILLTGNIYKGAQAKLTHYGLAEYFTHGAFADLNEDRAAIALAAVTIAEEILGEVDRDRCFVIGDTPHDIQCCAAIQGKAIAVATGAYSLSELEAHSPWWAIPNLPEPVVFLEKLQL
ncbi:HAD family hydrolase [Gloeocapsa sp. PCC 73106]|uniref:HAD family hydrolase n=1 Tax=Gloeocapsa sp. PCC 73106 TaxID=102232 RepID=UPI0002ABB494|nr:HAD hydrolase-like protein [Gloeocapsa sp. PCC 73106]ELR99615.1 putative phosphatase [Gloeocapsa sp. PCC 73106]